MDFEAPRTTAILEHIDQPVYDLADDDPVNRQILHAVSELSYSLNQTKSAVALNKYVHRSSCQTPPLLKIVTSIRMAKAPGFRKTALFNKIMAILGRQKYRLPVVRFTIDLFDKSVMRKIVLEESDSEEDAA